jgi:hypothetical protein
MQRLAVGLVISLLSVGFAGCGQQSGGGGSPAGDGDVASVEVALSVVPAGVQCVKVSVAVAGGQTITQLISVSSGSSSASLSLGQLPIGSATFNGSAYNITCGSVASSTIAAWIADPVATTLATGVVNQVPLIFRSNNPVAANVSFVPSVSEIAVGATTTFARVADGTIMIWGGGLFVFSPLPVVSLAPPTPAAVQLAAGFGFACYRAADGSVWCWGANGDGQLGPAGVGVSFSSTPLRVLASGATDISAGEAHVCAATLQMGVLCWGRNGNGQLGNGTLNNSATPVIALNGFPAGRVVAGFDDSCAVTGDGLLYCWGNTATGQQSLTPLQVAGAQGIVDIALGGSHMCFVRGDGAVRCWGSNIAGQLGDGTFTSRTAPVAVVGITDAVQVAGGRLHTCVRRQGGTVSCWGNGAQLGDGTNATSPLPVSVANLTSVLNVRSYEDAGHTCVETSDHGARCWGNNGEGTLGDGTFQFAPKPTTVKF